VENATWEDLWAHRYRSMMLPKALVASIVTFSVRYNMRFVFCKAETSGQMIREILYRDLKERIERGEFDGG